MRSLSQLMFSLRWSGANQQQGLDGRTRELDVTELTLMHLFPFLSSFFPLFYHIWFFPPTLPLTLSLSHFHSSSHPLSLSFPPFLSPSLLPSHCSPPSFSLSLPNSSCQLFYTDNPEVESEEEEEEKEEWRQCELHEEVCSAYSCGLVILM